jgi:hypothetical protein
MARSAHTLNTHIDHLREKSGLRTFAQIAVWMAENAWFGWEEPFLGVEERHLDHP